MNYNKIKKWIDFTNEFQKNGFWSKYNHPFSSEQFPPIPQEDSRNNTIFPKIDIYRDEEQTYILIEAPGINREDIQITLQNNHQLVIQGVAKPFFPDTMDVNKERFYGPFERTMQLPGLVDPQSIQIHYHHGLIQLTYPSQKDSNRVKIF
ncbi:Hsp20/alpha crystallin family protein [Bacillus kwashiorkori]|uniref:Hsp20/alpha crystallin family protein n=1 Tax=Bacillus kwashiorkori TaxID=1522318 RepID=UPI00078496F9|nr:Hsp20/alpha crystallin family protein [Bacillus kwashiorkori]